LDGVTTCRQRDDDRGVFAACGERECADGCSGGRQRGGPVIVFGDFGADKAKWSPSKTASPSKKWKKG
jgi:hypothetical protein